jgi:hypothetical protein
MMRCKRSIGGRARAPFLHYINMHLYNLLAWLCCEAEHRYARWAARAELNQWPRAELFRSPSVSIPDDQEVYMFVAGVC